MATYAFELVGCDASNLEAVKAAIAAIRGVSFSVHATARGGYILVIECDHSEDEILSLLSAALASLGVKVAKVSHMHTSKAKSTSASTPTRRTF